MVDIKIRAPQIRSEVTINGKANFAEALARLFDDTRIDDPATTSGTNTPLVRRAQNILDNGGDGYGNGTTRFSKIFSGWMNSDRWGDTGFKECFRDRALRPASHRQIGHFMTALDMGYRPMRTYLS